MVNLFQNQLDSCSAKHGVDDGENILKITTFVPASME
jgi:hypothetical protein